jgi:hypothetical protein
MALLPTTSLIFLKPPQVSLLSPGMPASKDGTYFEILTQITGNGDTYANIAAELEARGYPLLSCSSVLTAGLQNLRLYESSPSQVIPSQVALCHLQVSYNERCGLDIELLGETFEAQLATLLAHGFDPTKTMVLTRVGYNSQHTAQGFTIREAFREAGTAALQLAYVLRANLILQHSMEVGLVSGTLKQLYPKPYRGMKAVTFPGSKFGKGIADAKAVVGYLFESS